MYQVLFCRGRLQSSTVPHNPLCMSLPRFARPARGRCSPWVAHLLRTISRIHAADSTLRLYSDIQSRQHGCPIVQNSRYIVRLSVVHRTDDSTDISGSITCEESSGCWATLGKGVLFQFRPFMFVASKMKHKWFLVRQLTCSLVRFS